MRVHTNLGQFVSKTRITVSEHDFARLEAGSAPGSKRLILVWDARAENGQPAGTGAYVHHWNVTFFPADGAPRSSNGKAILGILRP
jgi:hypothetical protein